MSSNSLILKSIYYKHDWTSKATLGLPMVRNLVWNLLTSVLFLTSQTFMIYSHLEWLIIVIHHFLLLSIFIHITVLFYHLFA